MEEHPFEQGNEDRRKQEKRLGTSQYTGNGTVSGNEIRVGELSSPLAVVSGLSPQQQQITVGLLQVPEVSLQFRLSSPASVHSFSPESPSFSNNLAEVAEYQWRQSPTPAIAYPPPDYPPPDHNKLHHSSPLPQQEFGSSISWSQTASSSSDPAVHNRPSQSVTKPK